MRKIFGALGPWLALAALLVFCMIGEASFRNPMNYVMLGRQAAYTGIIALGMTLVIAAGGIDLSVGSLFALSGVAALELAPKLGGSPETGLLLTALLAVGCGLAGGAANGALVAVWKVPPFIATLGTMSIFRSLGLYFADAGRVAADNPAFGLVDGNVTIGMLIGFTALFTVMLNLTAFGRHVCAVGSNEKVALYSGIHTGRVKFMTYLLTGGLCGVSAMLWSARLSGISSAGDGMGYELDAIAAVIVGGTSMSGGKASMLGTLAGVLLLVTISSALVAWGVSPNLQNTVKGAVIIVAVLFQYKKGANR